MAIIVTYDGTPISHDFDPAALNIGHRAEMGEETTGGIPLEDPDGTLTIVGHRPVTVEEDECAQPRLFTGWTATRDMGRKYEDALIVSDARIVDTTIVDINEAFSFRQITGADGNRPQETWQARCTWILGSDYLDGLVDTSEDFIVTNTVLMDPADYRSGYPVAVMNDLSDRSGNAYTFFLFYRPSNGLITLFFDNPTSYIAACTLSISNVLADVDYAAVFPPDNVAVLAREPDLTYSGVTVEYNDGTMKLYRRRPSTETAYIRRETTIQRPYTKGLATATAQAEKWLDKHSVETDRITCSIQVPAASVGLIQAGQSIQARFSHLGLPYSAAGGATMRIVSYSPKPTDDTGYWYDVALELVYRPTVVVDTPCSTGMIEWVDDGPTTIIATGANSPKTTSIPQPSSGPAVIIAGLHLKNSYTEVNDYLANEITVASPWTMIGSDSDPEDETYRTHIRCAAYYPWTSGAVPDIVHSWTGVYTRPGEGFVMSVAVRTDATAPVQVGQTSAGLSESKITLASPPTEGNLLVLVSLVKSNVEPLEGWTEVHTAKPDGVALGLDTTIWARCAEADESVDIPVTDTGEAFSWWFLSEWTVSGSFDEVIDLGPTPGATTTHTVDPTVDDDADAGYTVGSHWINTTTGHEFVLVDSTTGAAVWVSTTAVSVFSFATTDGTTTVDPTTSLTFVGATLADLGGGDAEVTWSLPSGTPGGELGGTWASPTVDATHAGSTHLALGSTSSTAAAGDHTHASAVGVAFLLADDHSTPFVFDDLLQNEAGDNFLYGDP